MNKKKLFKEIFNPKMVVIGLGIGALLAIIIDDNFLGFSLYEYIVGEQVRTSNEEGRFYCWWIDDIINTESYKNFTDFQKDLLLLHKKWCIEEPRPSPKGKILMING